MHDPDTPSPEVAVIIPALNEAESVGRVVAAVPRQRPTVIIVADNGSSDGTADAARAAGATVVHERERGYGAACLKGMAALPDSVKVVAFLDADLSDDPASLPALIEPILAGEQDLVIGTRTQGTAEKGALTGTQVFGNRLACILMRLFFKQRYTDLGPCRAIRRESLDALRMRDRTYGWTVEMQIKAARHRLRVTEIPVPYARRRTGRSKISGTILGSMKAGAKIVGMILRYGILGKGPTGRGSRPRQGSGEQAEGPGDP